MKNLFVTGGAGFIGSHFVELAVAEKYNVVVLDALTYAGHRGNLASVESQIHFVHGDITDTKLVAELLKKHDIDTVVNFAAESHVDRSIDDPGSFIRTNVNGTFSMLRASQSHWQALNDSRQAEFRFLQVSTDEVFGALGEEGKFSETTPYAPNSPYSASKAAADHLVRAWFHTYKFPTLITNCSNNYGPRQFPEKLIPHMIRCALDSKPLPVYGNGKNVRDWIYVGDHCHGILQALKKGVPGESYCFGGNSERRNLDVVHAICQTLSELRPRAGKARYDELIHFVEDRKGHDWRYAIDDSLAMKILGYQRKYESFEEGLRVTIKWYIENETWMQDVLKAKSK
jgi:dTDP-glucose 4,6-dehydratase